MRPPSSAPATGDHPRAASKRPRYLRLDLQYDGTDFLGWQRQAEGRTVQGVVEAALERILGRPHAVVGAGRTDAGTHARHMVASTMTNHAMPARELARGLDAVLPDDVGVHAVSDAPEGFHARRDALWKWYRYSLLRAGTSRPLYRRRTWHVRGRLDREVLDAGAAALEGRHDFQAFANAGSPRHTTVRTMFAVRWTDDDETERLHLDVVGDGFLYRMVRSIVGTLVHWARNRVALEEARSAGSPVAVGGPEASALAAGEAVARLFATGDHAASGPVAPARGLCLNAVGVAEGAASGRLPLFLHRAVESVRRASPGGPP